MVDEQFALSKQDGINFAKRKLREEQFALKSTNKKKDGPEMQIVREQKNRDYIHCSK